MRRTLILFLALATCPVAFPQNALTNADIIKMVKAGLPDDVILQAIESQPTNFDISAQALISLKQQGVSTAVLNEILTVVAAKQPGGAPAKTVSTPAQSQPPPAPPQGTPPQATVPTTASPQALAQGTLPVTSGSQGPSSADEEFLRALLQQIDQMRTQPIELSLSQLLDHGLVGMELPAPYDTALADLLAPYNRRLHQYVDQVVPLMRQQLGLPSTPVTFLGAPGLFSQPPRWTPVAVSLNELEPAASSTLRITAWPGRGSLGALSYPQTSGGVQSTSSPGQAGYTGSANLGNGVNETVNTSTSVDTGDTVGMGDSLGIDVTMNPNAPVGRLKSADISIKDHQDARVNRCPEADGKDPGTVEETADGTAIATPTTGTVQIGHVSYHVSETAEGHVGDDARIRDVVVQANYDADNGSSLTRFHWGGTATFDPHGAPIHVPLQFTYCSWGLVNLPLSLCPTIIGPSYTTYPLAYAYLKAESKWNFEQSWWDSRDDGGPQYSACVIAKFTPPTRTVRGQPGQSIPIESELLTIKGHQPTWGIFKELHPYPKETIRENGTHTAPDAPAELVYTASLQPWPCNKPPGFGVQLATSRAGALSHGWVPPDDSEWFLAPTCAQISIHERTDVDYGPVAMATDVTFPMDLTVDEQGQVTGQATVQRSSGQASPCVGGDVWTEMWHASGTWDEKTDVFTLKLWFEATPRQGVLECPGPKSVPHFAPGFRSDAFPTPLNRFTLSDRQGAAQHFVIPFTPAAKHIVDVTVVAGIPTGKE